MRSDIGRPRSLPVGSFGVPAGLRRAVERGTARYEKHPAADWPKGLDSSPGIDCFGVNSRGPGPICEQHFTSPRQSIGVFAIFTSPASLLKSLRTGLFLALTGLLLAVGNAAAATPGEYFGTASPNGSMMRGWSQLKVADDGRSITRLYASATKDSSACGAGPVWVEYRARGRNKPVPIRANGSFKKTFNGSFKTKKKVRQRKGAKSKKKARTTKWSFKVTLSGNFEKIVRYDEDDQPVFVMERSIKLKKQGAKRWCSPRPVKFWTVWDIDTNTDEYDWGDDLGEDWADDWADDPGLHDDWYDDQDYWDD